MQLFAGSDRILTLLERISMFFAAAFVLSIMAIAVVDVALRYGFNAPLPWSYDLISLYLMAGVFFLGLPQTLGADGHVSVDILHNRLSARQRHTALIAGYVLSLGAFAVMVVSAFERLMESYMRGETIIGSAYWPTWISMLFITVGLGLTLLRVLHRALGHTASAISDKDVIALPPISGQNEAG